MSKAPIKSPQVSSESQRRIAALLEQRRLMQATKQHINNPPSERAEESRQQLPAVQPNSPVRAAIATREEWRQKVIQRHRERQQESNKEQQQEQQQAEPKRESRWSNSDSSEDDGVPGHDNGSEYDDSTVKLPRRKNSEVSLESQRSAEEHATYVELTRNRAAASASGRSQTGSVKEASAASARRPSLESIKEAPAVPAEKVQVLHNRVTELQFALDVAHNRAEEGTVKAERLEAANGRLAEENGSLQQKLADFYRELEHLEQKQRATDGVNLQLQGKLEALEAQNAELRQSELARKQTRKSMMMPLPAAAAASGSLDEEYVAAMEEELDLLTLERDDWRAKAQQQQQQQQQSTLTPSGEGESTNVLGNPLDASSSSHKSLVAQIRSLEDEMDVYKVQNQGLMEIVTGCEAREAELVKRMEALGGSTTHLESLKREIDNLQVANEALEGEKMQLASQLRGAEQAGAARAEELGALVAKLQAEQARLVLQVEAATGEAENQRHLMDEIKADLHEALDSEERKRNRAEAEIARLQQIVSANAQQQQQQYVVQEQQQQRHGARRAAPPPPATLAATAHQGKELPSIGKQTSLEEAKARRERIRAARLQQQRQQNQ